MCVCSCWLWPLKHTEENAITGSNLILPVLKYCILCEDLFYFQGNTRPPLVFMESHSLETAGGTGRGGGVPHATPIPRWVKRTHVMSLGMGLGLLSWV